MSPRRPLLLPLVPLYAAALALRQRFPSVFTKTRRSLTGIVISVGSVSAGGAGKTPVVLLLAELLHRRGYAVDILTRGYGRSGTAVERVDPQGDARRFGDEPLLLARRSGVPVYVGADRFQAGQAAERDAGRDSTRTALHLLDDGFQHRALARDLDVVLLTRRDVSDLLLPAGDLREPLSMLREADILVIREDEAESLADVVSGLTRSGPSASRPVVWQVRRSLHLPATRPLRAIAFCGIARPESFTAMLAAEHLTPVAALSFPDHHPYSDRDIDRLLAQARIYSADGFLTTEKDAVKLTRAMRGRLEQVGPLLVPELHVTLLDEQSTLEEMITRVGRLDRRRR